MLSIKKKFFIHVCGIKVDIVLQEDKAKAGLSLSIYPPT